MARYFTLQQAEKLLPQVEASIREGVFLKAEFQEAESELQSAMHRVTMMGGLDFNRSAFTQQRDRREGAAQRLKEVIEKIQELGCLVKDLDQGLVDFPTLYKNEEVYLCWKLGESGIAYWHKVEDGFRGRQPIDSTFLDNHRGESPN